MPVYIMILSALCAITVLVCVFAGKRLALAALSVAGGFGVMVFAGLVLGWRDPQILLLASCVDLVALICVGRAIDGRTWPSGVHVAGICMCVSLVAHPAYQFAANETTLAYYMVTNIAMGIACLGLMCSGIMDIIARRVGTFSLDLGGNSRVDGLASRREGE